MSAGCNVTIIKHSAEELAALAAPSATDVSAHVQDVREVEDGFIVKSYEQREIFDFHSEEMGALSFDVRGIRDGIYCGMLENMFVELELNAEYVQAVYAANGVEETQIKDLTAKDLARPGIGVMIKNGNLILIDGNHRLVARWRKGLKTFRLFIVPFSRNLMPYVAKPENRAKFFRRDDAPGMTILKEEIRNVPTKEGNT